MKSAYGTTFRRNVTFIFRVGGKCMFEWVGHVCGCVCDRTGCSRSTALDSYSGGARFECWPGHGLPSILRGLSQSLKPSTENTRNVGRPVADRGPIRLMVFLRSVFRLLFTGNLVPSSPTLVTLIMEAKHSSETSVLTRATRCNNSENGILHSHQT
jgi:hypothetical protein